MSSRLQSLSTYNMYSFTNHPTGSPEVVETVPEPKLDKPMELVVPPPTEDAYDVALRHRRLRVNSVQLLYNMLVFRNGKAEMNIPLV